MKYTNYYFLTLLSVLVTACNPPKESPLHHTTFTITGNKPSDFLSSHHTPTRNASTDAEIKEGEKISFSAQGGIEANQIILTYNGSKWLGNISDTWITGQDKAFITAFYPPLTTGLYEENGRLRDYSYVCREYSKSNQVQLQFTHIFSQISFTLPQVLNDKLENITFTPSAGVSEIDPQTANIRFNTNSPEILFTKEADCRYTFIIPPTKLHIQIKIKCSDGKTYTAVLPERNFDSGILYICPISYQDESVGIYTVEDFIAFTHLINGNAYGNRSLEEFGNEINGRRIFQLKSDISFTTEQSKQLQQIGVFNYEEENKSFRDIFDGNNHTLSGISVSYSAGGNNGIFGGIAPEAIVKNLRINNAVCTTNNKTDSSGFLFGMNQGLVENCHVENGRQESSTADFKGGIGGRNRGIMVNCHSENIKFAHENSGGLVAVNQGKVLNCYVANNSFSVPKKSAEMFYQQFQYKDAELKSEVYNCYVAGNKTTAYAIAYAAEGGKIAYCYYPKGKVNRTTGTGYSAQAYTNEDNLPDMLNSWITEKGTTAFPDYSFTPWEKGSSLPAIFIGD